MSTIDRDHSERESDRVLEVFVGEKAKKHSRRKSIDAVEKAQNDEKFEPVNHLVFSDYDELDKFFSKSNMEILKAIRTEEPTSVNELAEIVGRDYKNVYNNVDRLEKLGVIGFEEEGNSKKPVFRFDGVDVQIDFSEE